MAENKVTTSKILSIAGLLLFSGSGWMFNKIIEHMEQLEEALDKTVTMQARLDERMKDLEDDCGS